MDVADDRRRLDLVEQALHDRADALLGRPRALRGDRTRGAGEVEEVRALGVVELQRPRQRLEHELRDAADLAALQAPVVVGADAGQRRDLLAAQPGHPPLAVARQAGLLGRDLRPARGEELGDVVGGVHAGNDGRPFPLALRGPLKAPYNVSSVGTVVHMNTQSTASRSSPAPRRASARPPPARWPPTATASHCWPAAPTASRRWPTSSRRRDRHRGRRHRPRLARRRRPARPGRARRRRRPGQQRRRDAAGAVHLRPARRSSARWSRSTCSAR